MKKYIIAIAALLTAAALSAQNHQYVDLGLPSGTLWATCNIGADSPYDYGDYFSWGETEGFQSGKDNFVFATYRWGNSSKTLKKYNSFAENGTVDNLSELEPCDDAAHVLWGEGWRIPSEEQVRELVAGCTWEWADEDGHHVCRFTSKANGNSIRFSAGSGRWGTDCCFAGFSGSVWTRTIREDDPVYARTLYMEVTRTGKTPGFVGYPYGSRFCGHCIRPVYER